jgi:transcriptional regulator with XRE-family HTH domain
MGAQTLDELVGRSVADLRLAAGLSQEAFGRAMSDAFGYRWQRQTVSTIERGKRPLSLDEVHAVAAFFSVRPAQLIGPGGSRVDAVRIAGREISPAEWFAWWEMPLDFAGAEGGRAAIASVLKDRQVARPWADHWNPEQSLPTAYMRARDEALRRAERRPSTPIYLWEGVGPFGIGTAIAPWGQSVSLELKPGEPYYCRDDVEAGKLREQLEWQEAFEASPKEVGRPGWLEHGRLRRITSQEAYRIRKRKERTDGMGS